MKKTNYTLIITFVIIGLVAIGVYSRVKNSKSGESEKTERETLDNISDSDKQPVDSFIATPYEIAEFIDKDGTEIAEFFHDKGNVNRRDDTYQMEYYSSTYTPKRSNTSEELYIRPNDTLVARYTFRGKNQFTAFFEEVANMATETMTYSDGNKEYSAFKIGNCMFVKKGFTMYGYSGDKYEGTMYSLSQLRTERSKAAKQPKPLADSSSNNEDQTLDQ